MVLICRVFIDVLELNKPSDSELGTRLQVTGAGESTYSDLDDLLVNYIGAIVKKLDTLMQHEKYRPEDQLGKLRMLLGV
jgi:transcription elongation factor SPT6